MSISRKSRDDIKYMKMAGNIVALCHKKMKEIVEPGILTIELDNECNKIIKEHKAIPTFLGYNGFPYSICVSINDEVVHGFPSKTRKLNEGDIVSIDIGATYHGFVGDSAWTYPVGNVSDECKMLLETTESALFAGISQMKDDNTLDDVGRAIEDVAKSKNLGIVRNYGGHGVGRKMHEEPFVYNYATGSKVKLKHGMTIAIEPMLNLGCDDVYTLDDNWTVVTCDGKPSAHFEHTCCVTDGEPILLTAYDETLL